VVLLLACGTVACGDSDEADEGECDPVTPHRCADGACRVCCEDSHCDDSDACTVDECREGSCVHPQRQTPGCQTRDRICPLSDWCWENPYPQGNRIISLWLASSGDLWAVGLLGTVLTYNGQAWLQLPPPTSITLTEVWGLSNSDLWVLGEDGSALHFDGSIFENTDTGVELTLLDMWGFASDDVWAVGQSGCLLHWTGPEAGWNTVDLGTDAMLTGIWGDDRRRLWITGADGTLFHRPGPLEEWVAISPLWLLDHLYGIYGTGTDALWAVGENGTVLAWDESAADWQDADGPGGGLALRRMAANGKDQRWAVGPYASLARFSGPDAGWSPVDTERQGDFFDVVALPDDRFLLGGSWGLMMENDGMDEQWRPISQQGTDVPTSLTDVWACGPDEAWVVGKAYGYSDLPVMLRRGIDGWQEMESPAESYPTAVFGRSDPENPGLCSQVWILSGEGVFRYEKDTASWQAEDDLDLSRMQDLHGDPGARQVWAVGSDGRAARRDPATGLWRAADIPNGPHLLGVWVSDQGRVWTVAHDGSIYTRDADGDDWRRERRADDQSLFAVFGLESQNLWAVGQDGLILRRTAEGNWIEENQSPGILLLDLGGPSASRLWAVGRDSDQRGVAMRRVEDGRWEAPRALTEGQLDGIHAASADAFWMVGDPGAVLRGHDSP